MNKEDVKELVKKFCSQEKGTRVVELININKEIDGDKFKLKIELDSMYADRFLCYAIHLIKDTDFLPDFLCHVEGFKDRSLKDDDSLKGKQDLLENILFDDLKDLDTFLDQMFRSFLKERQHRLFEDMRETQIILNAKNKFLNND